MALASEAAQPTPQGPGATRLVATEVAIAQACEGHRALGVPRLQVRQGVPEAIVRARVVPGATPLATTTTTSSLEVATGPASLGQAQAVGPTAPGVAAAPRGTGAAGGQTPSNTDVDPPVAGLVLVTVLPAGLPSRLHFCTVSFWSSCATGSCAS